MELVSHNLTRRTNNPIAGEASFLKVEQGGSTRQKMIINVHQCEGFIGVVATITDAAGNTRQVKKFFSKTPEWAKKAFTNGEKWVKTHNLQFEKFAGNF